MYNWATLNNKVFRRLGFSVDKTEVSSLVNCRPGAVELLLMRLQKHISEIRAGRRAIGSPHAQLEGGGADGAGAADAGAGAYSSYPAGGAAAPPAQHDFASAAAGIAAAGSAAGAPGAPPQLRQLAPPPPPAHALAPGAAAAPAAHAAHAAHAGAQPHHLAQEHAHAHVDAAILAEKDAAIRDLHETVEILELKIRKLEQLVKLKDSRIATLTARLGGPMGAQ